MQRIQRQGEVGEREDGRSSQGDKSKGLCPAAESTHFLILLFWLFLVILKATFVVVWEHAKVAMVRV